MLVHPIAPVFDKDSKVLILGSFPSVKSREEGFFYGHPQNRFWKVTSRVFGEESGTLRSMTCRSYWILQISEQSF